LEKIGDQLYFSASDLNEYLECRHLTHLRYDTAMGREKPPERDAFAESVAKKGDLHEKRYLASLESQGDVARIPAMTDEGAERCVALTLEAMRKRSPIIYQACFLDGNWRGQADFLYRVDGKKSRFGNYSYEVGDTKLALHTRPYHLLQLCFYSEMLARVQETVPEFIRVVLGAENVVRLRLDYYSAYYRRVKAEFLADVESNAPTYPTPCAHCQVCRWNPVCEAKREADEHLSLVANIRRTQIDRLVAGEIETFTKLGRSAASDIPNGMVESTFEALREQARLQLACRETGENTLTYLHPDLEQCRGFALLPPAHPGDVFFDMEGDPFYWERDPGRATGLEYLFGFVKLEGGMPCYDRFFARNRAEEKVAFEGFVDFILERHRAQPGMHVYHYAHYEKSALKEIAAFHATREDQVDELLRAGVLVDLYQIVRQALRLCRPSYSIKEVEAYYRSDKRTGTVAGGAESILAFEQWLEKGEAGEPQDVIKYNEDDCRSTWELCTWLRAQALEAAKLGIDVTYRPAVAQPEPENTTALRQKIAELSKRLKAGYPKNASLASPPQEARRLLADLLEYHRREDRPAYWKYYFRRDRATFAELLDDSEAIVGLKRDAEHPPFADKKSTVYTLSFPKQETKLHEKSKLFDPATDKSPGTTVALNAREGRLVLKRGEKVDERPLPAAVISGKPFWKVELTLALIEFAEDVLASDSGSTRFPALWDILIRARPRRDGMGNGEHEPMLAGEPDPSKISAVAASLDNSYLFVQGPPGSGKTYTGAQMIVALLAAKKRVGIAANAHKAIHNLLDEVESAARKRGVTFKGYKRCTNDDEDTKFASTGPIENVPKPAAVAPGELIACTVHSFPKLGYRGGLDFLFVDEAGQVALADALAIGTAARNVVLLGDPLQLAQVSQGTHPQGAGASVLEHLLGDAGAITSDRGVFLEKSRRMHPDVCRFISTVVYDGKLGSIEECSSRSITIDGAVLTGLRQAQVRHAGRSQRSEEEAQRVVEIVRRLREGTFHSGAEARPMGEDDIMVVAPYNAQVSLLAGQLEDAGFAGVRVGTVDKFQGQEAPAVIYSMTTSSGADLPRDLDFLFSRNRLNVAISRAQCLAILVYSPLLLEIRCNDVEQMRLVNALCLFAEEAAPFER
jgi:uncharacterized protein